MAAKYGSLPFEEQIAYFRQKANVDTERWADIWKEAHNRSFMVAGATRDDVLGDLRQAVDTAIAEGRSLGWFRREFNRIVERRGWAFNGTSNWRSQVIYETNLRQSYSAGREAQIERIKHKRPFGIYKHTAQEHPRELHLSWNNLVLPLDDPWWETHTPINGYGCKCKKFSASQRDLDRLGLKVSKAPAIEHYEFVDKVTGEVHQIPKGIDPGFDYRPKSPSQLTAKLKKTIEAKPPLATRLKPRVVDSAYSTISNVNASTLSTLLEQSDHPHIGMLSETIKKHNLKTLFIKQAEMSGKQKSRQIAQDVENYLESGRRFPMALYTHTAPARTGGFTSRIWDHVVVKAKSTDSLKAVSFVDIEKALTAMLEQSLVPHTCSSYIKEATDSSSALLTTWLHEMGHQVHYKAGLPAMIDASGLTLYARTNDKEWFAEHFVLWVLVPDVLRQHDPAIFNHITDIMELAS
ncbi:phage minor head protein [Vibrio mediterranei]